MSTFVLKQVLSEIRSDYSQRMFVLSLYENRWFKSYDPLFYWMIRWMNSTSRHLANLKLHFRILAIIYDLLFSCLIGWMFSTFRHRANMRLQIIALLRLSKASRIHFVFF